MIRTIYFDDRKLIFSDKKSDLELRESDLISDFPYGNAGSLIDLLLNGKNYNVAVVGESISKMLREFSQLFPVIQAAGGIVENDMDQLLFIYRNGKWDLPKGKKEKGEGDADTALREVREEVGIQDLVLKDKAGETYHTYTIAGKRVLKKTHWFKMICHSPVQLIPQTEEGITEAKWIDKGDLLEIKSNTYGSIKDILEIL